MDIGRGDAASENCCARELLEDCFAVTVGGVKENSIAHFTAGECPDCITEAVKILDILLNCLAVELDNGNVQ